MGSREKRKEVRELSPPRPFTVALVGADGAGKTTVGRRLEASSGLPLKYLYMGVSPLASNYALPTTRLITRVKRAMGRGADMAGPPDPTRVKARPRSGVKRMAGAVKSALRLGNRVAEEWYRQFLVWRFQRQGYIVLFDRHFFSDYYAYDVADNNRERSLSSRIHGLLLSRLYPKPDLVICLDAPARVLLARKGEGTLELLELRRQEYLQLDGQVKHFAVVDATQPRDRVIGEITELIRNYYTGVNQ